MTNPNIRNVIFISSINEEYGLAEILGILLKKCLGSINCETFIPKNDIGLGDDYPQTILDHLRRSKVTIGLFSKASFYRPWINLEAGATLVQKDSHFIPVAHTGFAPSDPPAKLPLMISKTQFAYINTEDDLKNLITRVGEKFDTNYSLPSDKDDLIKEKLEEIIKYQETIKNDYRLSNISYYATIGSVMTGSYPFNFYGLLEHAEKSIFLAGQNLYWLLCRNYQECNKGKIFEFLRKGTDQIAQILICDLDNDKAVDTWESLFPGYKEHLKESTQTLKNWLGEANNDNQLRGKLKVKTLTFVPVSMTFVDAYTEDGICVLIPNVYERIPGNRPYFVVTKKVNRVEFEHYKGSYDSMWGNLTIAKELTP